MGEIERLMWPAIELADSEVELHDPLKRLGQANPHRRAGSACDRVVAAVIHPLVPSPRQQRLGVGVFLQAGLTALELQQAHLTPLRDAYETGNSDVRTRSRGRGGLS